MATKRQINTHYAYGYCPACKTDIVSCGGGKFVSCKCGESFIDQERWSAEYVRCGGQCRFITQVCPKGCNNPKHKNNDKAD